MEHFLATWGYLAIFILTFISAMAIPVGAEVAIGYGGVLASGTAGAGTDHLNLVLVIVVAVIGEVLGSFVGYLIGYFGGRPLVDRFGKYVLLTHKDLDRAEAWFARRGEPVVLFGRFVPLVRTFVSIAAGLAEMTIGKFAVFTVIGCAVWCTFLASVGYALSDSWNHIMKAFSYAGYVVAVLVVLGIIGLICHRVHTIRAERAKRAVLGGVDALGGPSGTPGSNGQAATVPVGATPAQAPARTARRRKGQHSRR